MSTPRLTFLYPWLLRNSHPKTIRLSFGLSGSAWLPEQRAALLGIHTNQQQERHNHVSAGPDPHNARKIAPSFPDIENSSNEDDYRTSKTKTAKVVPKSSTVAEDSDIIEDETPVRALELSRLPHNRNPLETVLRMPPPSSAEVKKAPHLTTPPYVHHFDTYSSVKGLENGGFSQGQAITIMKAVRGLLTQNMDLAKQSLVSKSDVENETYLFRAACSELRTEIQNNRNLATEQMRSERTQLQHETDILSQRMSYESSNLKDELKGMFDDRKMAVRIENQNMEGKIQELNYQITVALNSDARSEVEGLRWILTRRAVAAIALCAIMFLATLRYSSYMTQTQAQERRKLRKMDKMQEEAVSQTFEGKPLDSSLSSSGEDLLATEGGVSLG